jgi:hypothetical protein
LAQPPNYKFNQQEKITLSAFKNDEYYAIFVQDYFGSLDPNSVLNNLQRTGLGLNTVIESGFSLHVVTHPGEMTAVSIFIPNVKSYVSFRKAFRFFSVTSLKKRL